MPIPQMMKRIILNFPSNKLELGLWLESERMLHPVIDEAGVKTQNEVEKRREQIMITGHMVRFYRRLYRVF